MNIKDNLPSKYSVLFVSTAFILTLVFLITFWILYLKELRRQMLFDFNEELLDYDYILDSSIFPVKDFLSIKDKIQLINDNQVIHNENMFGPVKTSTFILVIQVHNDVFHLKELVQSLKYLMGITGTLLVFSHDYYNAEINNLIRNITFTKWMQIFYPYSTQLHPKIFPGPDPFFCVGDFDCEENGNLRQADYAQLKHFWWWQLNFVFDHLKVLSDYKNSIVFLEEDQYVLKDFLYLLRLYESTLPVKCPDCEIMTFGTRDPMISQYDFINGYVILEKWDQNIKNYGFVFNRSVWMNIKEHSKSFCYFNDYKWDQSLRYLGHQRAKGQFLLYSSEGARVLRYKKCEDELRCDLNEAVSDVGRFAWTVKRGLFPRSLVFKNGSIEDTEVAEGGDWLDVRDRELCLYFTKL